MLVLAVAGATFFVMSQRSAAPAAPTAPVAEPVGGGGPLAPTASTGAPGETFADQSQPDDEGSGAGQGVVVVHVAGAVREPGVVELASGTRVDEAIAAAGGPTGAADLDALNLAAPVIDGQQVYVPQEGETAPPPQSTGASTSVPESGAAPVDINTADAAALDKLPGIGPALAQRIIDWRTENGPFASVEALTDVSGIGPATMQRLRDLVIV